MKMGKQDFKKDYEPRAACFRVLNINFDTIGPVSKKPSHLLILPECPLLGFSLHL
jgi:hypothetical protein